MFAITELQTSKGGYRYLSSSDSPTSFPSGDCHIQCNKIIHSAIYVRLTKVRSNISCIAIYKFSRRLSYLFTSFQDESGSGLPVVILSPEWRSWKNMTSVPSTNKAFILINFLSACWSSLFAFKIILNVIK